MGWQLTVTKQKPNLKIGADAEDDTRTVIYICLDFASHRTDKNHLLKQDQIPLFVNLPTRILHHHQESLFLHVFQHAILFLGAIIVFFNSLQIAITIQLIQSTFVILNTDISKYPSSYIKK